MNAKIYNIKKLEGLIIVFIYVSNLC